MSLSAGRLRIGPGSSVIEEIISMSLSSDDVMQCLEDRDALMIPWWLYMGYTGALLLPLFDYGFAVR
jgi:hypothetical protein